MSSRIKKEGKNKRGKELDNVFWQRRPLPFSEPHATVYLQQPGVQQQRVGRLGVVVALFVEVAELVEVPGREQLVRRVTQTHSLTSELEVAAGDPGT